MYARIEPTHEFVVVRHAVIGVARELERRLPDLVTTSWWKEGRGERVFVDFNQANRDRTIAGAYSPRPLPGAPVSMPLSWDDLIGADPRAFTVGTVPRILAQRGCAWASIDDTAGDVTGALALWQADLDRGLGELNFPPDYPKMPGEPPRVPPSKRKADRPEADYLAPKGERDAEWGTPIVPPFGPMLARSVKKLPAGDMLFEPKWDGFRTIIWRSGDHGRDRLAQHAPDDALLPRVGRGGQAGLPGPLGDRRRDHHDRPGHRRPAQLRPAAAAHPPGRVADQAMSRRADAASFVAFDLLALGPVNYAEKPFRERRAALVDALAGARPPIYLTQATDDRTIAQQWFEQFEGAGLDGVIAKPMDAPYAEDKRVMYKIKHERTADCVVAGYRLYRGESDAIGSLLLGLYTDEGVLNSVGVIGAFTLENRRKLFEELQPLVTGFEGHPWAWAEPEEVRPDNRDQSVPRTPTAAAHSRWNARKDLSFTPLSPDLVVEVRYDHMEGVRFRHTAQFVRWRPDRDPASCTYAQLDEPVGYDLSPASSTGAPA